MGVQNIKQLTSKEQADKQSPPCDMGACEKTHMYEQLALVYRRYTKNGTVPFVVMLTMRQP